MELLELPVSIRALPHGFGNTGITGWFLLLMFILISESRAQKGVFLRGGNYISEMLTKCTPLYSSRWP